MVSRICNPVSWIRDLSANGKWQEVFSRYNELRRAGIGVSDPFMLSSIIKASSRISSSHGKAVHACVVKLGLASSCSVANSTLDFYVKCQDARSAATIFRCMGTADAISWNIMVNGFLNQGDLEEGLRWFKQARAANFEPNISTLVLVIQACRLIGAELEGLEVHGYTVKIGFWDVLSVQNSLLCLYANLGMQRAQKLFDEMADRDILSWSVIIQGYVNCGEALVGLEMFRRMAAEAIVEPDEVTVVSVVKASANRGDLMFGNAIHGFIIRKGLDSDVFVVNSLIDMYSKCKDPASAVRIFRELDNKNHVSWNATVSGLILNEKYAEALLEFKSMIGERVEFDEVTLVNVLQVCKCYADADPSWSKSVHGVAIRRGHEMNELLLSSLIDIYGRCNYVELSWKLFTRLKIKDIISWSTMIAAFTHNGRPDQAIRVFNEMMMTREKPNAVTMINLFEACSLSAELERSKAAHCIAVRRGLAEEVAVGTAVVDMYSKCGAIESSRRAFHEIPHKNIVSWSAMIAGCGMNGLAREAIALLSQMRSSGLKPNAVTALSVLSACSHGGLIKEGMSLFESLAREYGISPGPEHYSCVIDMLGRSGKLEEAMDLIKNMPKGIEASPSAWGAILSSCRSFGNSGLGEGAIPRVLELQPRESANYMLASSVYAAGGLWSEAARMRKLGKERGVKVIAGYSLVNVNNMSRRFVAGDENHPMADRIKLAVDQLHRCMRIKPSNDLVVTY